MPRRKPKPAEPEPAAEDESEGVVLRSTSPGTHTKAPAAITGIDGAIQASGSHTDAPAASPGVV